jgi:diguanylate cyclase (GGDEF)-like protein
MSEFQNRFSLWRISQHLLVLVILLNTLSSCAASLGIAQPKAVQGVLDVRRWDFARDGPVKLDGDWEFYWDRSVRTLEAEPKPTESMRVPGSWLQQHPARGMAVYRLRVLTAPGQRLYGIKVYEFPQSYRLYVNAERIVENGRYSEIPESSSRSLVRPFVVFANSSAVIDLRFEAVNFDEAEPGPRRSIILGLEPEVRQVQEHQLIADMLVCGVLVIMAVYHLGLYFQRRHETGSLLFGLLCLIMILRIAVTEEHYLHKYVPGFPANLEHWLDVFSFFILVPAFAWIFRYFFDHEFHRRVLQFVIGFFLIFGVVYTFFPLNALFNIYLLFTLAIGLYLMSVLFQSIRRRRLGSGVFLAGFLMFVITSIWDILSLSNIIRSTYVSPIGFVCFIFAQAYVLSMRFNRALTMSEQLTVNLETLVTERTQALEASNQQLLTLSITDALTGIANRRHFDEVLQTEWNRALRTKRALALLILDIDHFKAYNDHYGHQAGDACLKTVAQVMTANVHRAGDTLARYGGEEFVILSAECSGAEALSLAEKVRQAVEQASILHAASSTGWVSISVGIGSRIPAELDAPSALVKLADEALYRAKHVGRNQAVLAP